MPFSFTQILHTSRGGMLTRQLALDTTSNNLANVYTNGYKSARVSFQEMLDTKWLEGNQISSTQYKMEQGALRETGNGLDLGIQGQGFFQITLPDDVTAYTRDGEFYLDSDRQIVTAGGFPLVWDGEIPEDATKVHVNPDGTVMALVEDEWEEAGTVELARVPNPSGMEHYGNNLWLETETSGEAETGAPGEDNMGQIFGGALEQSNVNVGEEMVNMMTLQRSFEMSLRMFQQTDTMLSQAIHMRR
jgi:flagellar basal-body rod protein FlgG